MSPRPPPQPLGVRTVIARRALPVGGDRENATIRRSTGSRRPPREPTLTHDGGHPPSTRGKSMPRPRPRPPWVWGEGKKAQPRMRGGATKIKIPKYPPPTSGGGNNGAWDGTSGGQIEGRGGGCPSIGTFRFTLQRLARKKRNPSPDVAIRFVTIRVHATDTPGCAVVGSPRPGATLPPPHGALVNLTEGASRNLSLRGFGARNIAAVHGGRGRGVFLAARCAVMPNERRASPVDSPCFALASASTWCTARCQRVLLVALY